MKKITPKVKYVLFSLMLIVCCTMVSAQERTCGMEAYMQEKMADPEFAREHEANQLKFREEVAKALQNEGFANRRNPIVIPVAVHFPGGNEANRACLEALAQTQIDILNADYTQTNTDFAQWGNSSQFYPGVVPGAANIFFCVATLNHPANTDPQLVEGGPAVTIGMPFGNGGNDRDARWSGYMNFVVKNIGAGLLGYSPLGGSIAQGQAVVMNLGAFGSGNGCPGYIPGAPYNLGRTVTHELGHFYNLDHSFTGSCASDDGIADTPNDSSQGNYGCPNPGSVNKCGNAILTMNYMDYVNDACMYLFTTGQTNVVDAYLNVLQAQFKPNVVECTFGPDFLFAASSTAQSVCPSAGTAAFNFTFTSQSGFNENTVFSATGQPAGSTITFNPASRSTTGPFTMTVNNLGGAALGDYPIVVTATSTSDTKTQNIALNLRNTPCASVGNSTDTFLTSTTGVIFNTISNLNNNPSGDVGYSNFTNLSTNVNRLSSYDLSVYYNPDGNYQTITYVWIDWNQNCSFNDPGEQYNLGSNPGGTVNGNLLSANSPLAVVVPNGATLGSTIMRVTTKYTDPGANQFPTSCENGHDAEVEDYTINVQVALGIEEFGVGNFSIFPNPNKGQFTVSLNSSSNEKVMVTVYDIRGRKVFDETFENSSTFSQSINLNSVQAGMYLVKVSDGSKQATKKIIVE